MSVAERIIEIKSCLPSGTKLVAVSKTKPVELILEAYHSGQRIFGENKVQEIIQKYPSLPKDIEWHLIGHLQTNKVKYIAHFIDMIESVDSLKLLHVINNEAKKHDRIINFLFQVYIASEEAKFGLTCEEVVEIIASKELDQLTNVKLCGLMGMATFTDDEKRISSEFATIKSCFDFLKKTYFHNEKQFAELSIGMSSDYKIALKHGSTLVRIGSSIFGER